MAKGKKRTKIDRLNVGDLLIYESRARRYNAWSALILTACDGQYGMWYMPKKVPAYVIYQYYFEDNDEFTVVRGNKP